MSLNRSDGGDMGEPREGVNTAQFFTRKGVLPALGSAVCAPSSEKDFTPRSDTDDSSSRDSSSPACHQRIKKEIKRESLTASTPALSCSALSGVSPSDVGLDEEALDWKKALRQMKSDVRKLRGNPKGLDIAMDYFMVKIEAAELEARRQADKRLRSAQAEILELKEQNLNIRDENQRLKSESLNHREVERKFALALSDLEKERQLRAETVRELEVFEEENSECLEEMRRENMKLREELADERLARATEEEARQDGIDLLKRGHEKTLAMSKEKIDTLIQQLKEALDGQKASLDRVKTLSSEIHVQKDITRTVQEELRELKETETELKRTLSIERKAKSAAEREKHSVAFQLAGEKRAKEGLQREIKSLSSQLKELTKQEQFRPSAAPWKTSDMFDSCDDDDGYSDDDDDEESFDGWESSTQAQRNVYGLPKPFNKTPSPQKPYKSSKYRAAPAGSSSAPSRLQPDPNRSMKDVSSGEQVFYHGKWWYCRKNGSSCYIYRTKKDFDNRNHFGAPATTSVTPSRRR